MIAPGQPCTITLKFTPNAAGAHSLNFHLRCFPPGGGAPSLTRPVTVG